MSPTPTVCLAANTISAPELGGHLWVYLNWALGLRSAGCEVYWLEHVDPSLPPEVQTRYIHILRSRLEGFGMKDALIVYASEEEPVPSADGVRPLTTDVGAESDLLLSWAHWTPAWVVELFPRSALVDTDPGLTQIWLAEGQTPAVPYDLYFTTGETVGRPGSPIPDAGVTWHHTPPAVALSEWPIVDPLPEAPYTTVVNWWGEWLQVGETAYDNSKRVSFLDYFDLPTKTKVPLELAMTSSPYDEDIPRLRENGWSVIDAWQQLDGPSKYRDYIVASRGEFSCAKPSCMSLQNAWISDRTLCYLATGKPAVIQDTGPSSLLPDLEGTLRFRTPAEAASCLEEAEADYERHSRAARKLVEEYFDSVRVATKLLERALA